MKNEPLIAYDVIIAAKKGDPEAIYKILNHYDRIIDSYARHRMYDEYGNPHTVINADIKDYIQSKIISSIIYEYDPYSLPDGETLED